MSISNLPPFISASFLQKSRFPKRQHWQTRWLVLPVIALMMMSTNLKAEEKLDVNWSFFESSPTTQRFDSESRISFIQLPPVSKFVNITTEPPSPFPGEESALYANAEKPDDGWFRLVARLFVDESATQGTFEFEFRLVKGALNLSLGHSDNSWIAEDPSTYSFNDSKFGAIFYANQEIQIRGRPYQTSSISTLNAGENYRFMIKWNMDDPGQYICFLNGEPLTPVSGTAESFSGTSGPGINAMRISMGISRGDLGSFFLGRISASSAPVDLYSPDGLIK